MATVEGASHIVRYVNPAFCRLIDNPKETTRRKIVLRNAAGEGQMCDVGHPSASA